MIEENIKEIVDGMIEISHRNTDFGRWVKNQIEREVYDYTHR